MSRSDISSYLIHFTKEIEVRGIPKYESAFKRLNKIVADKKLIAGNGLIKGGYPCVCFSEAPLSSLSAGLLNPSDYSKYSPFGIMVSKSWLFAQGGRPVIYQPEADYEALPENHRWRHVKYELREDRSPSDFTWEREWRIHCVDLAFDSTVAKIVVPDPSWANRLSDEHENDQHYIVQQYAVVLGEIAEGYRQPYEWSVICLKTI